MIWKRTLLLAVLVLTGVLVETSILGEATLVGTKPQVLLLFTVALAMGEGPGFGSTFGFVAGLISDLLTGLPAGLSALVYTIVGYTVGAIRAQFATPSAWLPVAMVFTASLGGVLLYGALAMLVGEDAGGSALAVHALFGAAYNGLLTPFLFPVARALGARLRPAGVIR